MFNGGNSFKIVCINCKMVFMKRKEKTLFHRKQKEHNEKLHEKLRLGKLNFKTIWKTGLNLDLHICDPCP